MKTYYSIVIFALACIWGACSTSNQPKNEKELQTIQQINEKVQAKDYQIDASYANTARGKNISLSYGYNLIIRNDSAFAYLPYFGVAYTAPYGSSAGGIKFEQPMKNYQATPKKDSGEWTIKFNVDTFDYNYDVSIDIYSNGKASMHFSSTQRQSIDFSGDMKL